MFAFLLDFSVNFVISFQIKFKLSSLVRKIFNFICYPMWLLNFYGIFWNTFICSYDDTLTCFSIDFWNFVHFDYLIVFSSTVAENSTLISGFFKASIKNLGLFLSILRLLIDFAITWL